MTMFTQRNRTANSRNGRRKKLIAPGVALACLLLAAGGSAWLLLAAGADGNDGSEATPSLRMTVLKSATAAPIRAAAQRQLLDGPATPVFGQCGSPPFAMVTDVTADASMDLGDTSAWGTSFRLLLVEPPLFEKTGDFGYCQANAFSITRVPISQARIFQEDLVGFSLPAGTALRLRAAAWVSADGNFGPNFVSIVVQGIDSTSGQSIGAVQRVNSQADWGYFDVPVVLDPGGTNVPFTGPATFTYQMFASVTCPAGNCNALLDDFGLYYAST